MSGLTSQPNLSSIVAAMKGRESDTGLSLDRLHEASMYWEGVRRYYAPFESDVRAGTADVYRHEMPGGQYTNLREISAGKTLLIRLEGQQRDAETGMVKLQFELNGQPRTTLVEPKRSDDNTAQRSARPIADSANPLHVCAPMPGAVSNVLV